MKRNVVLSARGQFTLPAEIRDKFGLEEGSLLTVEDQNGAIILRPAAVLELEIYGDDQIQGWMAADYFPDDEKKKIQSKLKKKMKR
jgi:antitoxin PrlF